MLEMLLVLLATLFLAKHPSRGRYSLRRVRSTAGLTLGTLGSVTAITIGLTGASDSQYRLISVKLTWDTIGQSANEGPIIVGLAHSDYTVTEIKEALEANTAISAGDKVAGERANRLVRIIGTFGGGTNSLLNDGRPIKTRLNWLMTIGDQAVVFAYNDSGSALTTGAVVNVNGDVYVKDAS